MRVLGWVTGVGVCMSVRRLPLVSSQDALNTILPSSPSLRCLVKGIGGARDESLARFCSMQFDRSQRLFAKFGRHQPPRATTAEG
jgi:hypothetical protein